MRQNEFTFRVNWGDTDMAGIAYYPNFFKWFDIAGHQFFRSAGLHPAQLEKKEQVILPIIHAECTFEKAVYYDEILTIRTRVEKLTNKTIKLFHEIYKDEERKAYGHEIRGWVKKEGNKIKAVSIPEHVRKILEEDVVLVEKGEPRLMA